jgi:hypothetical protein
MRVRRALTLSMTLAASLAAREAHAQQSTHLSWVREESVQHCPDARAVEARIRHRMGTDPFASGAPRVIEAVVRYSHGTYYAHITIRDPEGTLLGARDLSSEGDCEALASAAAVAIALNLTSDLDEPPTEPATNTSTSSAPPAPSAPSPRPVFIDPERPDGARAEPPPRPPLQPRHASTRRVPWPALRDNVGVIAHAGLLPSVGLGVGIASEMRLSRYVSIALGFDHLPEQAAVQPRGAYAFGLTFGQFDACFHALGERRETLAICTGLAAGGLHGFVFGSQFTALGELFWAAATASIHATVPICGPLEASFALQSQVHLTSHRFALPDGTTFTQSLVSGMTQLGLAVRFP